MPSHKTETHAHATAHTGRKPMTSRTSHKHAAPVTETATHTEESETPMKPKHATKTTHHVTSTNETETATMTTTTAIHPTNAAPIPTATPASPATAAATPTPTAPVTALPYIKAPPPITLPAVPSGVVTVPPAELRALLPRKQELELMPDVEKELARFPDFAGVFGKTAPSQAVVEQTLTSAFQWSTLRIALTAWEKYALSQEIAAWVSSRSVIGRLSPAFALAIKTDSSIGDTNPSLVSLFGVRSSIAKRAVAVRKANDAEKGAGNPAYKGAAGKRRKTADEKAALVAQGAAKTQAAVRPAPAAVQTEAPAPASAPSAVVLPAAPVAAPPVPPAAPVDAPSAPVPVTTPAVHG